MWVRRSLHIFLLLAVRQDNVLCGCLKKINKVFCNETTNVSELFFNETIGSLKNVESIEITNSVKSLRISPDAFKNALDTKTIMIKYNDVQKLFANSFKDLRNLETIYLYYNDITDMYAPTFFNLSSLQKIYLNGNKLTSIRKETFKYLLNLNVLDLSNNKITELEDAVLSNLPNLIKLKLNNNHLNTVFVHKILSYPEKLEILWLHYNVLTVLSNFMLQNLTNLKILNLGFNNISTIEAGTFTQTPKLQSLVLTHNKLKEINGNVFPKTGMDFLEILYIDHNHLMFLQTKFFIRLSSLKSITLMGNPWFCPCLEEIYRILRENEIKEKCQQFYTNGQKPVCISENVEDKLCNLQYNYNLSDKYVSYLEQYPLVVPMTKCII